VASEIRLTSLRYVNFPSGNEDGGGDKALVLNTQDNYMQPS